MPAKNKTTTARLKTRNGVKKHAVVSRDAWITARKALLAKEKAFTKARDGINQQRRNLPWVRVEKEYVFDGPDGGKTLAGLFDGKSQLIVYHFMFGPGWKEGCKHCSFWADTFNGLNFHLRLRDTNMVAISRAPWKELKPFKKRMGWGFKWLSSADTDFNFDYHVSFTPGQLTKKKAFYNYKFGNPDITELVGISAFYKDDKGTVYHTYSTYSRGVDLLNAAYNYIDLTAKGRDENTESTQDWVRYHDEKVD